jgi:hypothetical protein
MSALLRTVRRIVRGTGFQVIGSSCLVEEEKWGWYNPEEFYPVRIGEVFKSQYQVVGKLGYGMYGTAWLCRDLLCAILSFAIYTVSSYTTYHTLLGTTNTSP